MLLDGMLSILWVTLWISCGQIRGFFAEDFGAQVIHRFGTGKNPRVFI